jgi:hypothetical protein
MSEKYVDPGILASTSIVAIILLAWTINAYVSISPPGKNVYVEDMVDILAVPGVSTTTTSTTLVTTTTTTSSTTTTTTLRWEEVECFSNADCGTNGTFVTKEFTCYEGNIYRQYVQFRCEKPGTREARCVGTEKKDFLNKCGVNEHCIDGDQYCAYALDVPLTKSDYVPENSTLVYVSNKGFSSSKGYTFMAMYVVSELDKPKRLAVDVIRPNGYDNWEYVGYNKGTDVGNISVGIKELYKNGYEIRATLWVLEKDKR